ncbi:MAG TPA: S41 family peptidase, partial [Thermoanaerobaculia bacterium]|nr:S41 family peptidase [Thermoanaerobaculia bacterium]
AEDLHFTFRVGDWMVPTHDKPVVSNFQRTAFLKEVPGPVPEGPVTIVKFNNGITYLVIASWSQEVAPRLEAVFEAIGRADPKAGLIVDVRPNGGGSELLAKQVAGCFVEATKVYAKYVTRSKGVDSPVRERSVSASAGRPLQPPWMATLSVWRCNPRTTSASSSPGRRWPRPRTGTEPSPWA